MPTPGLRLSYLRHFVNSHGGEASFAGKTTAQVCFEYVVPLTKPSQLSLVDHVANDPATASFVAPANWYVSHAWQYLFLETVDSLERFFETRGLSDDAVIWFCVFNNNQHLTHSYPFEYWSTTFKNGLAAIGNVVMIMHPWNDPIVLRRSWCVFEVYVAVTMGAHFEIALARDQEATFLNDIGQYGAFEKMKATIKCENSEATVASDRDGTFGLIRAETSFIAVDRLIFSTLTHWIKTTLEASISVAPSSAEKAERWAHLGATRQGEFQHADAERCFRHAVDLFTLAKGLYAVETFRAQSSLAYAMAYQRKPRIEWEPLYHSTIQAAAEHLGETHDETLNARSSYARALRWHDDLDMALPLYLEIFNFYRHKFGLVDWRTADMMMMIGGIYFERGTPRVAVRWLRKALPVLEATFGPDHSSTTMTISFLVGAYMYMGQLAIALPLSQRVAATAERTLGLDNSDTIVHKMNVAALQLMTNRVPEATSLLLQLEVSLVKRAELTRQLCDQLRDVRANLGLAYWIAGKDDIAKTNYTRILESHPRKDNLVLLYHFAVDLPTSSGLRNAALARVRAFVFSTNDSAPETWCETCTACCKPIVGRRSMCRVCPKTLFFFCSACVQQHPARIQSFCKHDQRASVYETVTPPRRFLFEDDLMAMDNLSYDDADAIYSAYTAYCDLHHVSCKERLSRTSIPSLSRGWHPMV